MEKMNKMPSLRIFLLFSSLLATPSIVLSAESFLDDLRFGVSVLRQESSLRLTTAGNTIAYTDDATGIELYADHYHKSRYRFKGSLAHIAYDSFDMTEVVLAADYLIPNSPQLSLFVGASAGMAMQQFTQSSLSDSSVGPLYGVQLGGIYYINRHFMAELGYRLRMTRLETEVSGSSSSIELEQLDEAYISLLLMF